MRRDKALDLMRGWAVFHMFFMHVLYWLGFLDWGFPRIARSWRFLARKVPLIERLFHLYSSYSVYAFMYHTFAYLVAFWVLNRTGLKGTVPGYLISDLIVFPMATFTLWLVAMIRERKDYLRKE